MYLTIILASLPAAFLYNLYGALLRAIGRANAALMVLAAAVTVNVALDYCFVARSQLGIAGAAWATAASQAISAVLCILYLRRKAPELIFARADCRMDGELLKQTAHFSFVTALHQLSLYIGKLLVQGAVNTGGTDMISAYTATTRIEGFANSFGDSGSAATSVLVAQNRGAGKEERVKESFRSSLFLMLAMGLAVPLIMYVSASTSVGFMLGTRSGAAFENARDYLKLVALFYTLCFTGNTFAGYFNGIGKVCVPFLGATSHIALRVVLSWLLVGKMGLPAVALATGLGWVLVNALCTFVKWRMEKKQIPFISGVTVSGGECSLYCEFVESLFKLCKEAGLNTMMDSNGSTPFAGKDDLLAVTDGVMLDIKAFGEEDHLKVTAMPNKNTLENAVFLAKMGKLFEIRTVIVPGLFDIENTIIKAGELLRPYQSIHPVRYKLISYRPFGVREEYRTYQSPSKEYMEQLEELAYKSGFDDVVTT